MTSVRGADTPPGSSAAAPGGPVPPAPVRTVSVPCPHCGETAADELYRGREHEYPNTTDALFPVVRCRACGLVRLDPRPDVSELGRIYPPEYYAYHLVDERADGPKARGPRLGERIKQAMYQRRLEALADRLGKDQGPIRLLDVGCADGRLLDWYRTSRLGTRLETYGIEMNDVAAARARRRGHRVVSGRFERDTELPAAHFDLLLAYHVIEHVEDPVAFARRAAELLAPGGLAVIATPNIDSWDARRFGRHWGGNHFPRHWTFYDPSSIGDLAPRVGLECERVSYEVNPVFWNWSVHSALSGRFPRAADRVFPPVDIFFPSLRSFVLLSAFTAVDLVQRALTGRTASMAAELRKPG